MHTVFPSVCLLLGVAGCGAPAAPLSAAPAVVPQVQLGGDWVIVEEDPQQVVVRWRDSGDGVRINLAPTDRGRLIGVAPIARGQTAELSRESILVPLVRPSFERLSAVYIEVQGPDLLVRMEGPPLNELTAHPDAPADPAIAWVRVRPRGATWRLALRGLFTLTLPGDDLVVHERLRDRAVDTAWGRFELTDALPAWRGALADGAWTTDSLPSLDVQRPYPELGATWVIP